MFVSYLYQQFMWNNAPYFFLLLSNAKFYFQTWILIMTTFSKDILANILKTVISVIAFSTGQYLPVCWGKGLLFPLMPPFVLDHSRIYNLKKNNIIHPNEIQIFRNSAFDHLHKIATIWIKFLQELSQDHKKASGMWSSLFFF